MITITIQEFLVSESTAVVMDLNENGGILFPFAVKFLLDVLILYLDSVENSFWCQTQL